MGYINMPESFQVKNFVVDRLMPHLRTVAECKLVMAIYRQTIGWQKLEDVLSLSRLEQITGMNRSNIMPALEWLASVGVIARGRQTRNGVVYAPQVDDTQIDWPAIENRTTDTTTKKHQSSVKNITKAKAAKTQKQPSTGCTVQPLEVYTVQPPAVYTVLPTETKETQLNPIGASAPKVSIADATKPIPQNNTSRTDMDYLDLAFNRLEKQANNPDAKAENTIRAWNLPPHLTDICLQFVKLAHVPVKKDDKGKWAKGASDIHELNAQRVMAEALKKGRTDRLVLTWPGALTELCKDVLSNAVVTQITAAQPAMITIRKNGEYASVPATKREAAIAQGFEVVL